MAWSWFEGSVIVRGAARLLLPGTVSRPALTCLVIGCLVLSFGATAEAAPTAKIIRIDPRPSIDGTDVTLTMVVDIGEPRSPSKDLEACGEPSKAQAYLGCAGDALQRPTAFYAPVPWPPHDKVGAAADPDAEAEAVAMTVAVNGADRPAELVSRTPWGKLVASDSRFGTSYLIVIDASQTMKGRVEQAKAVARALVAKKGKNDIFDIKWFDDASWYSGSGWTNDAKIANAAIDRITGSKTPPGRSRPLFDLIKSSALEGFGELGNGTQKPPTPVHHALVVLSNGWAGTDFGGSPPALAQQLGKLFADGILDENNLAAPRTPVPIISVWFPAAGIEEAYENARQFMKNMAVPNVGGAFYIVANDADARGRTIADLTHKRIDAMHVLEWKLPCLAASTSQSLKLLFTGEDKPILGDGWANVPLAVDPRDWPLGVDNDASGRAADRRPAEPGGSISLFGSFCWGNDFSRAEVYLIPKGDKVPQGGNDAEARKARDELTARGLRATPVRSGDNYVEVRLPDTDVFIGDGKARLIVVDGQTGRSSGTKEGKLLSVKAQGKPTNFRSILEIIFAVLVLALLVGNLLRGGGAAGRRRASTLPAPVVAGSGGGDRPSVVSPSRNDPPVASAPAPKVPGPAATVMFSATPPAGGVTSARLRTGTGVFQVSAGREFRIGRDPSICDFPVQDPHLSAAHARFKIEQGRLFIVDESSEHGTFINGSRVNPGSWSPVHHGAIVRVGGLDLMVELE